MTSTIHVPPVPQPVRAGETGTHVERQRAMKGEVRIFLSFIFRWATSAM
jgi:hypothetical protein